jgi:flagellar L-ring protein precursor FlgH|tara:strand:- start:496 stop:1155 length:660 start_codon:yes stop_codon:yes gene_type:complete
MLPLFLALSACDTYVEEQRSVDFEPIYLEDPEQEVAPADLGGIYQTDKGSLFAMEARAHRVGDILTVSFTESFQATKSQNAASSKTSENTVTLPTVMGSILPNSLGNSGELGSSGESTFSGSGSTNQSNSLTGLISVHVVRVYSNGNLEILGQKKLTLNNGDEYIRVSGIVRPRDISSENIVQSDRIANADINYVGAGDTARTGKKGWYTRVLDTINPI